MRITVVLPPWMPTGADRAALGQMGERVLDFSGATSPTALAARVVSLLEPGVSELLVFPTGADGEQAAALVAAQAGGVTLGRCASVRVEDGVPVATRAVFGGRAQVAVRSAAALTCVTLRGPVAATDARTGAGTAPPARHELHIDEPAALQAEPVASAERFPRVEGAQLVVSGGRGVGSPEGFELLARVARALGAGLGASLPAVDAGLAPVAHQVGQSGKFVSPRLYFAVGISGTAQHLAGISPAARIVALNSDADAAIFNVSEAGAVGDWREILPLLADELENP